MLLDTENDELYKRTSCPNGKNANNKIHISTMKHQSIFVAFVIAITLMGCNKQRPDWLPELYPMTVIIMQDGKPLEGASVQLIPSDSGRFAVSGITDAAGQAALTTSGKYPGAPSGQYKVIVTKTEIEKIGPPPKDEYSSQQIVEYHLVETQYGGRKTTPHEIEIISGKNEAKTFDVGKKIREKVEAAPGT